VKLALASYLGHVRARLDERLHEPERGLGVGERAVKCAAAFVVDEGGGGAYRS
jgi:hypothetical protein